MRILTTGLLSAFLIAAAPVLVGLGVNADPTSQGFQRETVIGKTTPDGTWPFGRKLSASSETASTWTASL
jgi:hypothetical protein